MVPSSRYNKFMSWFVNFNDEMIFCKARQNNASPSGLYNDTHLSVLIKVVNLITNNLTIIGIMLRYVCRTSCLTGCLVFSKHCSNPNKNSYTLQCEYDATTFHSVLRIFPSFFLLFMLREISSYWSSFTSNDKQPLSQHFLALFIPTPKISF